MKYFLSLLLFLQITANAQKTLDKIQYYKLQDRVRVLSSKNIDSAFVVANQIEKSSDFVHKAFAKSAKGYLYQLLNDSINSKKNFAASLVLINKAPKSYEKTKNLGYLYNYEGIVDWLKGNYSEALIKYDKGIKYSIEAKDIIQIIKFNTNIAMINGEIGNYKIAIKKSLQSEILIEKNKSLYTIEQYNFNKCNVYLSLGRLYETKFESENKKNNVLLDSAFYFYKKTIIFSGENTKNRIGAQLNMANILLYKNKIKETEKAYQTIITETKEYDLKKEHEVALYNLGYLYFTQKKYTKALVYFQKTDSIYNVNKTNLNDFIYSNYYQSKIYESFSDKENSLKHASIYLENFEKNEENLNNQSQEINQSQNNETLKKEMELMIEKYSTTVLLQKITIYVFIVIIAILILIYFKKRKQNKTTELKYNTIINEYKEKLNTVTTTVNYDVSEAYKEVKTSSSNLNLDEEKENLLYEKLLKLEEQKVFLNQDFTLQFVAKKIKTNTTYLSYVVNKRFGKTFSEYVNELKINYVVNEMITNKSYRKYSTQAIADSVGYKNATSFTKSFNKKTGLSPVKFAEKLNTDNESSFKKN